MKLIKQLILLLFSICLISCANQKPLTGGNKDNIPPTLIKSYPLNKSTNVYPKEIYLKFDEFININNANKNLLISPNLKVKVTNSNKTIKVKINDTLKPNTTYNFNFIESIEDISEKNKIKNLQYVFSTGNEIDSLKIEGNVITNETGEKVNKGYIILYDTVVKYTDLEKENPLYINMVEDHGSFNIQNIKKGNYKIFYLDDINSNFRYDIERENIGYINEIIKLDSNYKIHKPIRVFESPTKIKKPIIKQHCQFITVENLDEIIYSDVIEDGYMYVLKIELKDSNKIFEKEYYYNNIKDSTFTIINKNINQLIDTFSINIKNDTNCIYNIDYHVINRFLSNNDTLYLNLSLPINEIKENSIYYTIDTNITDTNFINDWIIEHDKLMLPINHTFDSIIKLYIDSNAFVTTTNNIFNKSNYFNLKKKKESGTISGLLKYNKTNFEIQLIDSRNIIVKKTKENNFNFNNLDSDTYTIKIKIDENNDGYFQTGNIKLGIYPEKIVFHKNPIKLLPGWEIKDLIIRIDD